MAAAIVSANEKPEVLADNGSTESVGPSLRQAAKETRVATPTAPPTCCTELKIADPRPASSSLVPASAAIDKVGKVRPHPRLVTSMPGSTAEG